MVKARPETELPSIETLRELFVYDGNTGELMWRNTGSGRRRDRKLLCLQNGYLTVSICGRSHRVHRVIWALVHGQWPVEIDHRNGLKTDNRTDNLRDCTHRNNCRNSRRK